MERCPLFGVSFKRGPTVVDIVTDDDRDKRWLTSWMIPTS